MQRAGQLLKRTLLAASVVLFGWSLTFDAYYIAGSRGAMSALLSLLTGWMGITVGGFSWLANPPLVAAWSFLLLGLDVPAALSASGATMIASTFLAQSSIAVDEAGNMGRISGAGLGYWMWLASMLIAVMAACWPPMRGLARERRS